MLTRSSKRELSATGAAASLLALGLAMVPTTAGGHNSRQRQRDGRHLQHLCQRLQQRRRRHRCSQPSISQPVRKCEYLTRAGADR